MASSYAVAYFEYFQENLQRANFVEFYEREVRRIPLPRTWVYKSLLVCLLALQRRIGA